MGLDEFGTATQIKVGIAGDKAKGIGQAPTPEVEKEPNRIIQWTGWGDHNFTAAERTWEALPSGVYVPSLIAGRMALRYRDLQIDNLFYFPDSPQDRILTEIEKFWDNHNKYQEQGYRHRRGYLIYGPQGGGKSALVQQTIQSVVQKLQGVVFLHLCGTDLFGSALSTFRIIEPGRPVLCVFEDIDALIRQYGESEILTLLDGESEIDNVLNLATTNYPELLDRRIVSRPRRFDRVIRLDMPADRERRRYLELKLPDAGPDEIERLVKETKGFSFAALAELIISTRCLGVGQEETLKILREMHDRRPSSSSYESPPMKGFIDDENR